MIWTARHPGQGGGDSPVTPQILMEVEQLVSQSSEISRAPGPMSSSAGSSRQPPALRESRRVQSSRTVEKRLRIRNCAQRRSPEKKLRSTQVSREEIALGAGLPRRNCARRRSPDLAAASTSGLLFAVSPGSASNRPCPRGRRAVRPCSMFEVCYPGWRGRPACAGVGRSTPGWKLIGRWPEEPC